MKFLESPIRVVGFPNEARTGSFILHENLDILLVLEAVCTFRCNGYGTALNRPKDLDSFIQIIWQKIILISANQISE